MKSTFSLFVLILIFSVKLMAQQDTLRGKVVNELTNEPICFATLAIIENGTWAISDEKGFYKISVRNLEQFTLKVNCLGMEEYTKKLERENLQKSEFIITLKPSNLQLDEVVVTAKEGTGITTTTEIKSTAIEHVQATSLADVSQLIPGNIMSEETDLSETQQISIREIGTDDNSAMGTAIVIDNAPISNDANLQTYSTNKSTENDFTTAVKGGVDLRQISTDNIESVEVIKGIPSVAYGNLTSGAVILKTKAGRTPFEVKVKTNPKIKQLSIGKGIHVGKNANALNFHLDYLQSYKDIRSKYEGFNRVTGSVRYSRVFNKEKTPLTLNVKTSFFSTIDDKKTDPDAMFEKEHFYSKDLGGSFNINGKWSLKKKLISDLKYTFSASVTKQESYEEKYRAAEGIDIISASWEEGENYGIYLRPGEFTNFTIKGLPVSIFGQLTASKTTYKSSETSNRIIFGIELRHNKNLGEGQIYDIFSPPYAAQSTSRPRKYKDIPGIQSLSYFIEDKLLLKLGKTKLDIQAGIRINNFQTNNIINSDVGYYIEPRFNARYHIHEFFQTLGFKNLTINFGIGKTYKSPTLQYLYPNKAYFDLSALNYYTGNPETSLSVINTRIYETKNNDLKPSDNLKYEFGTSFRIGQISGDITYFNEKLDNGFGFTKYNLFINSYKYETEGIIFEGKPDITKLEKKDNLVVDSYQKPINIKRSYKHGIEFSLNFGKIKALKTSLILDGAWLKTKRINSTETYQDHFSSKNSEPFRFYAVYAANESKISERLNTTLRIITQIPKLRLILSTISQVIWYDKFHYPLYDKAPIYLVYKNNEIAPFTDDMKKDPYYFPFIKERADNYYKEENMPPLVLLNFKLSKEFRDNVKLSMFVNNFINSRPKYKSKRSGAYERRNPAIFFGAELRVKF